MSKITSAKSASTAKRRTRKDMSAIVEKLAAEFGPKPGKQPKRVGAVEFLIKHRR